ACSSRAGETSACISLEAKRADATGTGKAGACAEQRPGAAVLRRAKRDERMRHDRTNSRHLAVVFKLRSTEDSVLEATRASSEPNRCRAGRQRTDSPRRRFEGA